MTENNGFVNIVMRNTWEVYNDYMGSGTNHLKCELEEEMKGKKKMNKFFKSYIKCY